MSKESSKALLKEGRDVIFSRETTIYLFDASGSMGDRFQMPADAEVSEEDREATKMSALRSAVSEMFKARCSMPTADKVAVAAFDDGYVNVLLNLTVMHSEEQWQPVVKQLRSGGSTPMYQALEKAVELLAEEENTLARIVLCTDGEPNSNYTKADVKELARLIGEAGIVIDCVGVGNPSSGAYDEGFLREVARLGAGEFFPVTDPKSFIQFMMTSVIERRALLGEGVKLLPPPVSERDLTTEEEHEERVYSE